MKSFFTLLLALIIISPVVIAQDDQQLEKLWQRDRKEQTLAVYHNMVLMFSKDDKGRKTELVSLETGKNIWDESENDLSRALQAIDKDTLIEIGYDYIYHDQYFFLHQYVRNKPTKLTCFNFLTGEKKWEKTDKYYWKLPQSFYNDKAFLVVRENYEKTTKPVLIVLNFVTGEISIERKFDKTNYVGLVTSSGNHLLLGSGLNKSYVWFDYVNDKIDTEFTLEGTWINRFVIDRDILVYDAIDPNDKCFQRIQNYDLFAYDLTTGKKLWQQSVYESNFLVKDDKVYYYAKQEICNDESANLLNIFDMKTKSVIKKIKTSNGKPHILIIYQKNDKIIVSQDTTFNKTTSNTFSVIENDKLTQTIKTIELPSMQYGDYVLMSDIQYSITDNQFYGHISCYKPPWFEKDSSQDEIKRIIDLILELIGKLLHP